MSCTKFPLGFSPSFLHHFFSISIRPSTLVFFPPTFRQISFVSPFWSRTENHSQRKSGVLRQTSLLCWPNPNPRSASRSLGIATRSTLLFLPVSLSLSLSLSASLTGSSCGANNIRSRRPEYWPISSFSISSPVTCSADSRYHHDVTYEARNQQKVSVRQCFRRSRRGNNPWSLQSHTEPRRRSESSAGTMFATQTAMLTLAYFLNSDMGHKTIPRASYRLPTSLPNTVMLPACHSPPVISQMRTIRWQSDLFTDHSVFPLLSVLSFFKTNTLGHRRIRPRSLFRGPGDTPISPVGTPHKTTPKAISKDTKITPRKPRPGAHRSIASDICNSHVAPAEDDDVVISRSQPGIQQPEPGASIAGPATATAPQPTQYNSTIPGPAATAQMAGPPRPLESNSTIPGPRISWSPRHEQQSLP
jgi:hypothetical protein